MFYCRGFGFIKTNHDKNQVYMHFFQEDYIRKLYHTLLIMKGCGFVAIKQVFQEDYIGKLYDTFLIMKGCGNKAQKQGRRYRLVVKSQMKQLFNTPMANQIERFVY